MLIEQFFIEVSIANSLDEWSVNCLIIGQMICQLRVHCIEKLTLVFCISSMPSSYVGDCHLKILKAFRAPPLLFIPLHHCWRGETSAPVAMVLFLFYPGRFKIELFFPDRLVFAVYSLLTLVDWTPGISIPFLFFNDL